MAQGPIAVATGSDIKEISKHDGQPQATTILGVEGVW
jgi:hypothetical protein